jgi:hypothetical protein
VSLKAVPAIMASARRKQAKFAKKHHSGGV